MASQFRRRLAGIATAKDTYNVFRKWTIGCKLHAIRGGGLEDRRERKYTAPRVLAIDEQSEVFISKSEGLQPVQAPPLHCFPERSGSDLAKLAVRRHLSVHDVSSARVEEVLLGEHV